MSMLKRSIQLIDEDEVENENIHFQKKQKVVSSKGCPLQTLNNAINQAGLLTPPTTPEHSKPKALYDQNVLSSVAKKLDLSSSTNSDIPQIYSKAKNLFLTSSNPYSNNNFTLIGRETEFKLLNKSIMESLENLNSSSIYVSGPPGTGKSCQINAIINSLSSKSTLTNDSTTSPIYKINLGNHCERKIRIVKINCMSISNPIDLFKNFYHSITNQTYDTSKSSKQLFNVLKPNDECDMTVLVLDEMDNIIDKSQQFLFELFTWASNLTNAGNADKNKPNLLLIGIANALDLTDRFLPRLRANCICPRLVQFLPYTADQISSIIKGKLLTLYDGISEAGMPPLVHPAAIQFCAKKSAITTGDLRKAFDIMYKSFETFESGLRKSNRTFGNDLKLNLLPKIMISTVVKVCSQSFNSNFDLKLKPLNLQQKIILTFLFKFEEKMELHRSKAKTRVVYSINAFFHYYLEHCTNDLKPLKRSEFLEIINCLDNHGLITSSVVSSSSIKKTSTSSAIPTMNSNLLNFDNYKVSTTLPKSEFFKNVNDIDMIKKIIHSNF